VGCSAYAQGLLSYDGLRDRECFVRLHGSPLESGEIWQLSLAVFLSRPHPDELTLSGRGGIPLSGASFTLTQG